MITLERSISFSKIRPTSKQKHERQTKAATTRVPRISRLMALAIRLDQLIRDGIVTDQAELARLGKVTRARLTQIMNLLCLAPDLQEVVLFLSNKTIGFNHVSERQLRPVLALKDWNSQRQQLLWVHTNTFHTGSMNTNLRIGK